MMSKDLQDAKRVNQTAKWYAKDGGGLRHHIIKPTKKKRLGEDKLTLPWRVQLLVQPSEIITAYNPVIYYVRGHNPHIACTMAHQLWQKWEKFDEGIFTEFPDIREVGYAECVDEDDFKSAYDEIKKFQLSCRLAGSPDDPMAFTCIGRVDL